MCSTILSLTIILVNTYIIIAQNANNCSSIYVKIENFGQNAIDLNNWNGVYSIAPTTSFNASIWQISGDNSNKWLKYIETHWILSGQNNELFIYESSTLFPPTDQTSTWIHEYSTDTAQIRLDCSTSLSPTDSPTPSPSTSPTYSPTLSQCDVLILTETKVNTVSNTFVDNWWYERLPLSDHAGRPEWQYQNTEDNIQSIIEYLNGWIVEVNTGFSVIIYSTHTLFGNYPTLNIPIIFHESSTGLNRTFTFQCLPTHPPTFSPTVSPVPAPTDYPTNSPTPSPTQNPHSNTPPPTFSPTMNPTVAPSVNCDVLKINIPTDLINNANPDCNIDFNAVFDTYWLKQIARSNRPSWTLDCDDINTEYTVACNNGYSGSVFFISNQWEIQIHSKTDDCFERFIVENTNSYFVPTDSKWLDQSTNNQYSFTIQCGERANVPTPRPTGATLVDKNTVSIYDQTWFWIAIILILLICCLICLAIYYWNKQRQKPELNVSNINDLELAPPAAYVDPHVAAPENQNKQQNEDENEDENEDLKIDDAELDGKANITSIGSTASDPNINPNLRRNVTATSVVSDIGEYKKEDKVLSDSDEDMLEVEDMYNNNVDKGNNDDADKALDMIAGKKDITGYGMVEDHEKDELLDDDEVTSNDEVWAV